MREPIRFLPATRSAALCCVLVVLSVVLAAYGVHQIVSPLVKYKAYAYYYAKAFWTDFIGPALFILLAIGLWRLKRWARLVLLFYCWIFAIFGPVATLTDRDYPVEPWWIDGDSWTSNMIHSPVVHVYAVAALALAVIHLLQIHRDDFRSWL